jgi:hypothetical protein
MAKNQLIVTLHLKNGVTHMSDPTQMDSKEVEKIMWDVQEALEGASGTLQFTCNEKTVLIRNSAVMSATFDYREADEDIERFGGA